MSMSQVGSWENDRILYWKYLWANILNYESLVLLKIMKMTEKEGGIFYNLESLLKHDYRGVNVCWK